MREARPYQNEAFQNLRASVRQGVKRPIIQLPCGGGKTLLAGMIADGALKKGGTLSFVVPAISLIDQTIRSFWDDGIRDVGVLQADHFMTDASKPIQVCSIQTIASRGLFPDSKVVVFDEVHVLYEAHRRWMAERPDVIFIGLSATPWTYGLADHFETLLIAATTQQLIDQKYLSPFKVLDAPHPDLKKVKKIKTAGEDYNQGEASSLMQEGTLVADIVKTWKKEWGKPGTLCFGVDRAHAQSIQQRFLEAGVSCGYQDKDTSDRDRAEIFKKFHTGEYEVVANVDTLSVGVDFDVRCLINARLTKSEKRYVQTIGRALRLGGVLTSIVGPKEHALILDHSATTETLGYVTQIHHEGLRKARKRGDPPERKPKPKALPKPCPECKMFRTPGVKKCENCGYEVKLISGIVEMEGELAERGKKRGRAKANQHTPAERRQFFGELKGYAVERQFKPGWAANQYKARYGEWPPRWMEDVQPLLPSMLTRQYIKSRLIAWAKGKQKAQRAGA